MITPRSEGGYGLDAQWDDDMHHALHAMLTGERQGYYVDFGSLADLAKVYTSAFLHDGRYSTFRGRAARAPGRPRADAGLPIRRLPAGSRPGRQPGARRPVARDHPTASAGLSASGAAAHVAIHAHALDG